ncbi:glycoside hydrolase/phage tail family protein [Caulobacter segnis]|uniref:baseplate multidomain protein megatron n=1 Tax=Caulobacter segnis TaxID=88688 RepID=UPI001CBEC46C|nr:glycoside hydrolase/phage tail family protein [Caulobacter segnis]UAL09559.1 glycoside hydrolase/phage tail family protein [Caulobacter segnis]
MAQVILSSVGAAIGGPLGAVVGAALGAAVDQAAISALSPARQVGPRIPELRLTGAAEGAALPCVFGRARVGGQVIWAARFREKRVEGRVGGSKGQKTSAYAYSLSFAVAVAEGPIDGIGRVWADGKVMDLSGATLRVHLGAEDQLPDPLIAVIEGQAPAYRGVAYVVFEDLPLEPYGNRPPQLSFEVFRRPRASGAPAGLEERLKGVCLIPGAGEFVYATEAVLRREGLTRTASESVHNAEGRPDLVVALDQLQAQLPNVDHVTLVVAWFGTDLRCGQCQVRPGVEGAVKDTLPLTWSVAGVGRAGAHLISLKDGAPAYGGTPADSVVLQAIAELKRRGLKVTLYPFILMDPPAGQAAYPWRGRITCEAGSDGTAAATSQVAAFFDGEWGLRRMVLHQAALAAQAGGVDGFVIGSELRGLTTVRGAGGTYPAVAKLKGLAAEVRGVVGPATKLGYAADWSEYFGHQPGDGSGHAVFHLDPLWADPNIDFVGVDWYPPVTDWREGETHLDAAAGFLGPHDGAYLRAGLTGGEAFDWCYTSPAARDAQARTPITDGAHGEAWMFRAKDLKSWWSNPHHDRPAGVRSGTPTAWVPKSKPIRLTEFGCPAVDKGSNSPNLFIDPKSSESFLPPYSTGERDDFGQRRYLEAVLAWLAEPAANPVSPIYGGPMVEAASAWCWDARPFPDFPARSDVWSDGGNWVLGHWLTGRAGIAPLPELIQALGARADVTIDPGEAGGAVGGYVVDRPMRLRDALAPLTEAFALDPVERGDHVKMLSRAGRPVGAVAPDDLALPDDGPGETQTRVLEPAAEALRLRFIDAARDYQVGALVVRREAGQGTRDADAPIVLAAAEAEAVARRMLAADEAARRARIVRLSPSAALRFEAGDRLVLDGATWRVQRLDLDERPRATLVPVLTGFGVVGGVDWTPAPPRDPAAPPVLHVLDLPSDGALSDDARPLVAAAGEPWRPLDIHAGAGIETLTVRARIAAPATLGVTLDDLPTASPHRLSGASLTVRMEGRALASAPLAAMLAGDNALAIRAPSGDWEVVAFQAAQLVAPDVWRLSGLLRGQRDGAASEIAIPAGASVVLLDEAVVPMSVAAFERGAPLVVRAAPAGGPPAGTAMSEVTTVWTGRALRPLAPAHLRKRLIGGDLTLSWIRRARVGGDVWADEVPLGEGAERYRVRVLDGATVLREAEVVTPAFVYTAAQRTADAPSASARLEVTQGAALYGWGAPATTVLW